MTPVDAAIAAIKKRTTIRELFVNLNGREGTRVELQTLRNRLSSRTGNPTLELIANCVKCTPSLQQMTLAELFGIEQPSK